MPEAVGGLVVATLLSAIGLIGDAAGFRTLEARALLRYVISGCLFLILLGSGGFILFSKIPSSINPSVSYHRFAKRHRLFAAITCGLSILVIGFVFFWPKYLPSVALTIINKTDEQKFVSRYAAFEIDLATPLEPDQRLGTGRAILSVRNGSLTHDTLTVPAHSQLQVSATIQKSIALQEFNWPRRNLHRVFHIWRKGSIFGVFSKAASI